MGKRSSKKEKAYEEETYAAACRYMLSVTCDDEDDYIPLAITPDLQIEEPNNSLKMGDEHLDTIPARESDEVIKSSVENLVPIPSEFEGIFDDTCDVPNCDDNRINVESKLVESLINRDTSIVYSSKINPILEERAGELARIAPIPPGIVEADFDPNDDTSSNDDSYEDIEYVDATPPNSELVSLEEVEDDILRDKLSNVYLLISKIEALNDNPTLSSFSNSDNSFSNHTDETRKSPEFESFHVDIYDIPSFPRPPPEPPDVCLDMLYNDESFEPGEGKNIVVSNVEEERTIPFTIYHSNILKPFLLIQNISPLYAPPGV
ncbi:hypothetical protein Tco_0044825 [Tanacetum coccineum]